MTRRFTTVKTLVEINGKLIPSDSVFGQARSAATLNWTNNADVQIMNLSAGKNFRTEYMGYLCGAAKKC